MPTIPRLLTMKAPPASLEQSKWVSSNKPEQTDMKLLKQTSHPSPFWNHKFLSIVKQYYHECHTIQQKHPEFDHVPAEAMLAENQIQQPVWEPTICGEDTQGENAYMAYIKKIYGMCCLINDDPKSFGTDVIPMVTRNGQIDMEKTITNAESICIYYSMDQSYAKPIVHFILWRVERMSRLFSECL